MEPGEHWLKKIDALRHHGASVAVLKKGTEEYQPEFIKELAHTLLNSDRNLVDQQRSMDILNNYKSHITDKLAVFKKPNVTHEMLMKGITLEPKVALKVLDQPGVTEEVLLNGIGQSDFQTQMKILKHPKATDNVYKKAIGLEDHYGSTDLRLAAADLLERAQARRKYY